MKPAATSTIAHVATTSSVTETIAGVRGRVAAFDDPALFIGGENHRVDHEARRLDALAPAARGPLFGVPFVVKDNIDVEGWETTAACRASTTVAVDSAAAVRRLVEAGAVMVAKTNLDQFATGLVGVRSPFGVPRNVLNPTLIPGGSSSGSATAVAAGLVPFSLGTDTAGSGRVPAAMNQIVGLKPTRGLVSTKGVVPACASLDCVSVFASTVSDALVVFSVLDVEERDDPWQRRDRGQLPVVRPDRARIGFVGNDWLDGVAPDIVDSYRSMLDRFTQLGASLIEVDLTPFVAAGRLLYGGPFVAERYAAVRSLLDQVPSPLLEITQSIIGPGGSWSAADYHLAQTEVRELSILVGEIWGTVDALATPSVPFAPTLLQVDADPLGVNTEMGRFSTFSNLLDLCALTLPDPVAPAPGRGMTLHGPALADVRLARLGSSLMGDPTVLGSAAAVDVVVVGAHLDGQPLNHELTDRGATFVEATVTSPDYRLWALPDGRRPALERVVEGGVSIAIEVWSLPVADLGGFASGIGPPLGLGTVALADGSTSLGFICEVGGLAGAHDISDFGGWRHWKRAESAE